MTPANIFEKVGLFPPDSGPSTPAPVLPPSVLLQVKTSEFYRYSRQLRQEVDQALTYFHDVNQQPLVESRSNRIRSIRPQTAVFRGMIGHSMVNSKILLLQRPKVPGFMTVGIICFSCAPVAFSPVSCAFRCGGSWRALRCHCDLTAWLSSTTLPSYWAERSWGLTGSSMPPPKCTDMTPGRTHGCAWPTCPCRGERTLSHPHAQISSIRSV